MSVINFALIFAIPAEYLPAPSRRRAARMATVPTHFRFNSNRDRSFVVFGCVGLLFEMCKLT